MVLGAGGVVLGAGELVVGAGVGCFRGDFGVVWAAGGAAGAGLGASAGFGVISFGLSDTFKVSVDAGPFS